MQNDSLDILGPLTCWIRTAKETNKLSSKPLDQWNTYLSTIQKITEEEGEPTYQSQLLKCLPQAKNHYDTNYRNYCSKVNTCIKIRTQWSDIQTICDIIFVLGTQGWQKLLDKDTDVAVLDTEPATTVTAEQMAIDRLVQQFQFPLESAGATVDLIKPEFESCYYMLVILFTSNK